MSESKTDRQLLRDCAIALERLLASPDLHLDSLEQTTREAVTDARYVLKEIRSLRPDVYCFICGKRIPELSFTVDDRGQLIAYAHRACADRTAQSAPPEQS